VSGESTLPLYLALLSPQDVDEDLLSTYKVHSAGGISSSCSSSSNSTPQPLPTMQTGQNPHDPLTQLNSHTGFGAMAGLNPFSEMGLNTNDPNMVRSIVFCVVLFVY